MTDLSITYAGAEYLDRTRALQFGLVSPEGVDLTYLPINNVGELFRRMAQDAEFDVSEMSMSTLMVMVSQGDDRLVGIPVFPSRAFRHSQIYIHARSGIQEPEDLAGRNVGVPEYQMTAALWQRALLQHEYGVAATDVHWWTGGLKTSEYHERHHHSLPEGVTLDRIPADKALEPMLEAGEIDAILHAHAPESFRDGSPNVARLFPNYRDEEMDYYRRTGLFPIMHTVVVRRDIYEANPWIVESLLDAFEASKQLGYARMRDLDTLAIGHPWAADEWDSVRAEFGGDPFAYGFEANLDLLEAMTQYSEEQGLSDRKLDPIELFAPEAVAWQPTTDKDASRRA